LLNEIEPHELGDRLRAARVAKGWTQTELAGDLVSVGYVSRIESGQRRPHAGVLEALASRLDLPVDQLLRGESAREQDEIRLGLDFAELSLENGDHAEAEMKARESRDRALAVARRDLADRASYLVARALEAQGNIDDAIIELEPLVGAIPMGKPGPTPPDHKPGIAIPRVQAAIALSRC
jgi:transcriptional regulator with XRE-family HTH domain